MNPVTVKSGNSPVVLAQPHSGTELPDSVRANLTPAAAGLKDTDWRIPELYEGLLPDATVVRANFNRYVIDANRSPEDEHLYPGQNTTALVPTTTFENEAVWQTPVGDEEVSARVRDFHTPYHLALQAELERVRDLHGAVILYDCHSIRSELPFLFDGELPALNVGTFDGKSCAPQITATVSEMCVDHNGFSSVVNGRFKGGWTTRHYGRPDDNIHAVQMEIAQRTYLESETHPFTYSAEKAAPLRELLAAILAQLSDLVVAKQI